MEMNSIGMPDEQDSGEGSLRKNGEKIEFTINDDGIGFDLNRVRSKKGPTKGLGLTSMKERTTLSGGYFSIESTQGRGTTIFTSWE